MTSSANIIGMKVHCNACEKEFPIGNKQQALLRNEQPIKCRGCKSALAMSATEMQRFLGFENPAKPLMRSLLIFNLPAVCVFLGTALGLLRSDALVLMAVVVLLGSNAVLGSKIKAVTKPLMIHLDAKESTACQS